jgi:hypothetical protein
VNSVDNFCYRHTEIILTKKKKWTAEYPNISLTTHPASLGEGLPIPEPPISFSIDCDEEEEIFKEHHSHLLQEIQNFCSKYAEPQTDLSDLIRDLKMLKNRAVTVTIKTSTLESSEQHCKSNRISPPPKHTEFFTTCSELSARENVESMIAAMNIRYNPEEWHYS